MGFIASSEVYGSPYVRYVVRVIATALSQFKLPHLFTVARTARNYTRTGDVARTVVRSVTQQ